MSKHHEEDFYMPRAVTVAEQKLLDEHYRGIQYSSVQERTRYLSELLVVNQAPDDELWSKRNITGID